MNLPITALLALVTIVSAGGIGIGPRPDEIEKRQGRPRAGRCYFPDGTLATGYQSCFPNQLTALCCQDGWACMDNGLCEDRTVPRTNAPPRVERGACTQSDWDERFCGGQCLGTAPGSMQSCGNDRYCCDSNGGLGTCDCEVAQDVFILPMGIVRTIIGVEANPLTTPPNPSSTTTAAPFTSLALAPSITPESSSAASSSTADQSPAQETADSNIADLSNPAESDGLSVGAKAGIGVGAAIAGITLFALLFICARRRGRRQDRQERRQPPKTSEYHSQHSPEMHQTFHPHPLSHQQHHSGMKPLPAGPTDPRDTDTYFATGHGPRDTYLSDEVPTLPTPVTSPFWPLPMAATAQPYEQQQPQHPTHRHSSSGDTWYQHETDTSTAAPHLSYLPPLPSSPPSHPSTHISSQPAYQTSATLSPNEIGSGMPQPQHSTDPASTSWLSTSHADDRRVSAFTVPREAIGGRESVVSEPRSPVSPIEGRLPWS